MELRDRILSNLTNLAEDSVPGAQELLDRIHNATGRELQNAMTEAFGALFARCELHLSVVHIETKRDNRSPHRVRENASCDLRCLDGAGLEWFIEVKDSSAEYIRAEVLPVYPLQTPIERRRWLTDQIESSVDKGANLLIARIPVWSEEVPTVDDIYSELWGGPSPQRIETRISLPEYFKGVWLVKSFASVFLEKVSNNRVQLTSLRSAADA